MATPDLRRAGLDPAHILAICEHVAARGGHRPVGYVTAAPDGVRVRLRSPRAARAMRTALTRTGYDTSLTCPGRRWDLLVTGWDGHALEIGWRRCVPSSPSSAPTPRRPATVIDRYRHTSARSPDHAWASASHPGRRGTPHQRDRPLRDPRATRPRNPPAEMVTRCGCARSGSWKSHR